MTDSPGEEKILIWDQLFFCKETGTPRDGPGDGVVVHIDGREGRGKFVDGEKQIYTISCGWPAPGSEDTHLS